MHTFEYALSCADGVSHRGRIRHVDLRVFRNDWSVLAPPEPGGWSPGLTVSVVIPTRGDQRRLDALLACLARQTYPAHLLEVCVVDDHSTVALRLPALRPARCRIERAPATGWGLAHAHAHGAQATSGQVLCWLDADLVVGPTLVETLVRWQHAHPHAVTLGSVHRSAAPPPAPAGGPHQHAADTAPHPWAEPAPERDCTLRDADHLGFQSFVGACVAMGRTLYETAGGVDPTLTLGHDTELGYRLWQAGGVFVPDRTALAWRSGPATAHRTRVPSERFRGGVLADLIPHMRGHRTGNVRATRRVPLVRAVVHVADEPFERVRACVDRLLSGEGPEVEVHLVADWDTAADTWAETRLVQAHYLAEPRVRFVAEAPRTAFPAPYLLRTPVTCGVGRTTVARMVRRAEWARAGLVELGDGPTLWNTRALTRALSVREAGESLVDAVAAVHGRYRMQGGADLVDLAAPPPALPVVRDRPRVPAPRRETVPAAPAAAPRRRRGPAALTRAVRALLRRLRTR